MKTYNSAEWSKHIPEGDGEKRSVLIPWDQDVGYIDFECRSENPVTLNAISVAGDTLFLAWGQVVEFKGKLVGYRSLEIVTDTAFLFRSNFKTKWYEVPDPQRLVVALDESTKKPFQDAIREELAKLATRAEAANLLTDPAAFQALIDDFENGDLEFEEEEDMFGLGSVEDDELNPEPELPLQELSSPPAATPPANPPETAPAGGSGSV